MTKYCTDNKNIEQKALPSGQLESLEALRIQDKISKPLNTPPIQKIYDSKSEYIKWLDKEYVRDQAFYEAVLKNPKKYKLDLKDDLINEEIDNSAGEPSHLTEHAGDPGDIGTPVGFPPDNLLFCSSNSHLLQVLLRTIAKPAREPDDSRQPLFRIDLTGTY